MIDLPASDAALLEAVVAQMNKATFAPGQRARMRNRVIAASMLASPLLRIDQGIWLPMLPGVEMRVLQRDVGAGLQLALWRLQPGACLPRHRHGLAEACFVLEGSIEDGGARHASGAFIVSPAGSPHERVNSDEGALLMIRGDLIGVGLAAQGHIGSLS